MHCKDRRCATLDTIPALYGGSDGDECQPVSQISSRRTARSVDGRLAIGANSIMQRQKGRIFLYAKVQLRSPDTKKLGGEPGPRLPFNQESNPLVRLSLMPFELTERLQAV